MIDIRSKIQLALDTSLASEKVYSYWNKKVESVDEEKDEYIVYTYGGNYPDEYSDDVELITSLEATIHYYYRDTLLESSEGRKRVKDHENLIENALINTGFEIAYGPYDLGDIDSKKEGDMRGSGFNTIVFECEYWVVM